MVRKQGLNIISPREPQTQTFTRSHLTPLEQLSWKAPARPRAGGIVGTGSPRAGGSTPRTAALQRGSSRCPSSTSTCVGPIALLASGGPPSAFTRVKQACPQLFMASLPVLAQPENQPVSFHG